MDEKPDQDSPEQQSILPFVMMMIWFAVLLLASSALTLLGLAFSSEPGGRGNPGLIDYLIIFGPLLLTLGLMFGCIWSWKNGKNGVALACCLVPILLSFATIPLFGI